MDNNLTGNDSALSASEILDHYSEYFSSNNTQIEINVPASLVSGGNYTHEKLLRLINAQ